MSMGVLGFHITLEVRPELIEVRNLARFPASVDQLARKGESEAANVRPDMERSDGLILVHEILADLAAEQSLPILVFEVERQALLPTCEQLAPGLALEGVQKLLHGPGVGLHSRNDREKPVRAFNGALLSKLNHLKEVIVVPECHRS